MHPPSDESLATGSIPRSIMPPTSPPPRSALNLQGTAVNPECPDVREPQAGAARSG
jgi:hypothetical protein